MAQAVIPIHQVLETGATRQLGQWVPASRRLELRGPGFPLLGPGPHAVEEELPWVFWDMCPSGFLGRRFARQQQHLALNADPRSWSVGEALRALTEAGEDLQGNLILGARSLERWQSLTQVEKALDVDAWLLEAPSSTSPSSLGGERPKLLQPTTSGGRIVKFSPPPGTPQGQRWAELLRVEAHCALTLRSFGVDAVSSELALSAAGRVVLSIDRFDRLPHGGRRGAVTLYWLSMARHGDVRLPAPEVVAGLVAEGHLAPQALERVSQVHAFSAALGNSDAHLGNYGLVFDDDGRAALAPFFDILPMALAPANDELPDARLRARTAPADRTVSAWLADLVRRVEGDGEISSGFRDVWRRHIGV